MTRDPEEFNHISKIIFSPIYPVIARRMLALSEQNEGVCLDAGTGPGMLACAIARESNMEVLAIDNDPRMLPIALRNVAEQHLLGRVIPMIGDIHCLPLNDNSIDLIVSRGSVFFWNNRPIAFREIERVLKSNGTAYVGGGFGTVDLMEKIFAAMREINPEWDENVRKRSARASPETLLEELRSSGIEHFSIQKEETGFWVEIVKS
jgi:ubiquinone/menaquinone biosynthesis C-methylase UbiE